MEKEKADFTDKRGRRPGEGGGVRMKNPIPLAWCAGNRPMPAGLAIVWVLHMYGGPSYELSESKSAMEYARIYLFHVLHLCNYRCADDRAVGR